MDFGAKQGSHAEVTVCSIVMVRLYRCYRAHAKSDLSFLLDEVVVVPPLCVSDVREPDEAA
jgi:hypothetical protein